MAKLKDGVFKQIGTVLGDNARVLLAGGGDKLITEFYYTKDVCILYTSDDRGTTPAAVKKAITEVFEPKAHKHTTKDINKLTDYKIATVGATLSTEDSLNTALGKLEYKSNLGVKAYDLVYAADNPGTIDNLTEILNLLKNIKDDTTLEGLMGAYVPLSGTLSSKPMTGTIKWNCFSGLVNQSDWSFKEGLEILNVAGDFCTTDTGAPSKYAIGLNIGAYYKFLIACYAGGSDFYLRGKSSPTWKTILHSENSSVSGKTITINGTSTTWVDTWRPTDSTYISKIDNSDSTSFSLTGAYNLYTTLHNGYASSAGVADHLNSRDTRREDSNPVEYEHGLYADFKQEGTNSISLVHGLLTFRPYGSPTDVSGGSVHLLAFVTDGTLQYRRGSTTTKENPWYSWKQIAFTTSDITGNASSADKLTVKSKTAWGLTYWTSGGIPTSIDGDMSGVGKINKILTITNGEGAAKLDIKEIKVVGGSNYIEINTNQSVRPIVLQLNGGNVGVGMVPSKTLSVSGDLLLYKAISNGLGPSITLSTGYSTDSPWAAQFATDYIGNNITSTTGFTHGLYFISGRDGFDNFIFTDASKLPFSKITKTNGNYFSGLTTSTGGFLKGTLTDAYVLLAGGGAKLLSDLVTTNTAQSITGIKYINPDSIRFPVELLIFEINTLSNYSIPFNLLWHDIIAFSKPDYYTSTDLNTWTTDILNPDTFAHLENRSMYIFQSESNLRGVRWEWVNEPYVQANNFACYVMIGFPYTYPACKAKILIESKGSSNQWAIEAEIVKEQFNPRPLLIKLKNAPIQTTNFRITITKLSEGNLVINSIKLLSFRLGDLGFGKENEYPYTWDGNKNIILSNSLTSPIIKVTNYITSVNGFKKGTLSNDNVLLAGGGHKALSDLNTSHNHDSIYVKKIGDTMSGNLTINNSEPILTFLRETATDGAYDWRMLNSGGSFKFLLNTNNTWNTKFTLSNLGIAVFNHTPFVNSYKIWHTGNDGTESGLDADLLDGKHASAFASKSHSHEHLLITDNRGAERSPSYEGYPGQALSTFFNECIPNTVQYWNSGINVAGWNTSYGVWLLLGGADLDDMAEEWYLRAGKKDLWQTVCKIWHSKNLTNLNQLKNGPGYITASSSITGNAASASTLAMGHGTGSSYRNIWFSSQSHDSAVSGNVEVTSNTNFSYNPALGILRLKKGDITGTLTAFNYSGNASGILGKVSISTKTLGAPNTLLKLFTHVAAYSYNKANYAGDETGFPVSNNANGILWVGVHTHESNAPGHGYAGEFGISSNHNIYYRYISNGSIPTTVAGGSWDTILTSRNYENYLLSGNILSKSITKAITNSWTDTGITGLTSGTYAILVYTLSSTEMSECYFSGMMSWFDGAVTDTTAEADEIILHRAGKDYDNTIYLRTSIGSSGKMKLEIASNNNLSSATYTFKFKKIC